MKRLPDGRLVVANGGIATDPKDRTKRNLDRIRPNLSLLSEGGRLDQAELGPALRQNSIRHPALAADGMVAFAMQWEGDPAKAVPLLGLWTPGGRPKGCVRRTRRTCSLCKATPGRSPGPTRVTGARSPRPGAGR